MERTKWVRGLGCVLAALTMVALLFVATPIFAQTAGTILGVVKDSSGGSIPDAKITVTNTGTNEVRSTTSGDDGAWRVPGLNPGQYIVKTEKDGFKTSTSTGLTLDVAGTVVVNPILEVGSATQEVTVTGEAPIVNTTTSSLGGLVNDQRIADLPLNGRNYMDLTLIQPGVQENTHPAGGGAGATGTWYSSNGAPPRSNNFTMDGGITTNQYGTGANSEANTTLGVDGIKEFKVVTSMFSADYGMSMGSQMVIVTKSGTNDWHGDAFEYLRNNALDARNFFDTGYLIPAGDPGHVNRLPQFQYNNFGGSTGGPIVKDKTFFYAVYEGLRGRTGATITDTEPAAACHNLVPAGMGGTGATPTVDINQAGALFPGGANIDNAADASACYGSGTNAINDTTVIPAAVQPWLGQLPIPNLAGSSSNYTYSAAFKIREDYSQLRIDQNISANDTFFGRYTFDDAYLDSPFANIQILATGSALPQYNTIGRSRNQWTTFGENHVFSPTLLNTVRLSFSRTNFRVYPGYETVPGVNSFGPLIGANWSAVPGYGGSWSPGSPYTAPAYLGTSPTYHVQNLWTLADDIFKAAGKNSFKFGFLGNDFEDPNLISKGLAGGLTFSNMGQFLQGTPSSISAFISPYPGFTGGCPPTAVGTAACSLVGNIQLLSPYNGNSPDRDFMFKTFGVYAQDDYRATNRLTLNLGLRYEFQTTFHELYNRETTILDIQHSAFATACPTCQMDNPSLRNFSPRVGFAWDLFGTGKTSIRSGFGIYYDVGNYGAMLTQVPTGMPPFSAQTNFTFTSSTAQPTFNQSATPCALGTVGTCSMTLPVPYNLIVPESSIGRNLQGNDYNMKQPYSLQYNLTVEQQLPFDMGLSVSYVGYRGIHLITGEEGNPTVPAGFSINGTNEPVTFTNGSPVMPAGFEQGIPNYNATTGLAGCTGNALNPAYPNATFGTNAAPCRINPYWGSYELYTAGAESWYSSLQVLLTKRVTHGLDFQAAYTYSHALDDTQGQMFGDDCAGNGSAIGQNPQSIQLDKGNSCFDAPNSFHFNFLYNLPTMKSNSAFSKIVNGWWMSSIVTINDGFPETASIAKQRSFDGIIAQTGADDAELNTASNTVTFPVNYVAGATPASNCAVNTTAKTASCTYSFIPYNQSTAVSGSPNYWYNPLMFGETALGTLSNSGRDVLPGPPEREWDFSIVKDTKMGFLGEQGNLEFRAEIFNILNHANFGTPTASAFYSGTGNTLGTDTSSVYMPGTTAATGSPVTSCNAGIVLAGCATNGITLGPNIQAPNGASDTTPLGANQIISTRTNSRAIQFALKLIF